MAFRRRLSYLPLEAYDMATRERPRAAKGRYGQGHASGPRPLWLPAHAKNGITFLGVAFIGPRTRWNQAGP